MPRVPPWRSRPALASPLRGVRICAAMAVAGSSSPSSTTLPCRSGTPDGSLKRWPSMKGKKKPGDEPKRPRASKAQVLLRLTEIVRIRLDGAKLWDVQEYVREQEQT